MYAQWEAYFSISFILQVHYDMSLYHTNGRFRAEPDLELAFFHLHKSADFSFTNALFELGCIYQQLPHYEFSSLSVEV